MHFIIFECGKQIASSIVFRLLLKDLTLMGRFIAVIKKISQKNL